MLSALSRTVSIIDLACADKKAPDLSALVHVPMVTVDPNQDASSHEFVMSVRPSYHVVNQALFDVMDSFSFSKVAVVYDGRNKFVLLVLNSKICPFFSHGNNFSFLSPSKR